MKRPGKRRIISPSTPPMPLGIGQVAGGEKQPTTAADKSEPTIQVPRRAGMRSIRRPVISAMDQARTGSSATTLANPRNCIIRSAKMAPP